MKIIITDHKIESIDIVIETPYELRALYILIQLISKPEFKAIRNHIDSFDQLPGLGVLCNYDIYQNPVRRLYNLINGINTKKPTRAQLTAIVLSCKKAIKDYNAKLDALFQSEIMQPNSDYKLPFTILSKAANLRQPISQLDFLSDRSVKRYYREHEDRLKLYRCYKEHQETICGFRAIDPTKSINVSELTHGFKQLSNRIKNDAYLNDDTVNLSGIITPWHECYVRPALFASYCGIGIAALLLTVKSLYDEELKDGVDVNSSLFRELINNSWTTVDSIIVLVGAARCGLFKSNRDIGKVKKSIEFLSNEFPEFKDLLLSKGFPYSPTDEFTYVSSQPNSLEINDNDDDTQPLLGQHLDV